MNLGGDNDTKLIGADLPLPARASGPPKFLVISGLGDYIYAAWEDGRLVRYEIRDIDKPRLVEDIRLFPEPNVKLTSLIRMVGGFTVVAGDSLGRVKTWFPVDAPAALRYPTRMRRRPTAM